MKITSMQKMIAVVVAGIILAAIVFVVLVLPMFTELDTLAAQKTGAEQQRQQAQAVLSGLEEAKAQSAATEAKLLKIGTQMPDSPQLPTLIIEMQDLANNAGVKVTSFSPAIPAPNAGGKYTEISLTTQITAKWDDLLDYLKRLSNSTRLLRVTNVTINPVASDDTSSTADADAPIDLNVSLTTRAYVIGNNGQIGAGSATPTVTP